MIFLNKFEFFDTIKHMNVNVNNISQNIIFIANSFFKLAIGTINNNTCIHENIQILCYRQLNHEIRCQKKYTQIHTHFELCFAHHFAFDNGTIFNISLVANIFTN
jgi:hypothetical protein